MKAKLEIIIIDVDGYMDDFLAGLAQGLKESEKKC